MLKLFDMLVRLILLYGSKIWGEKSSEQIESVQRRFCRYVLGLPLTATNAAKLGESGRYPISLFVQLHSSHDILAQTALRCYPNHPPKSTQTINIHAQLRTRACPQKSCLNGLRNTLDSLGQSYVHIMSILLSKPTERIQNCHSVL